MSNWKDAIILIDAELNMNPKNIGYQSKWKQTWILDFGKILNIHVKIIIDNILLRKNFYD